MREPRRLPDTTGPLQRLADTASAVPAAAAAAIVAGVVGVHDAITNKAFAGGADVVCSTMSVDDETGSNVEGASGGWSKEYFGAGKIGEGPSFIGVDDDGDGIAETVLYSADGLFTTTTDVSADFVSTAGLGWKVPTAYDDATDELLVVTDNGGAEYNLATGYGSSGVMSGNSTYVGASSIGGIDHGSGALYGSIDAGATYTGGEVASTGVTEVFNVSGYDAYQFSYDSSADVAVFADEVLEKIVYVEHPFDTTRRVITELAEYGDVYNFQPASGTHGDTFYYSDPLDGYKMKRCEDIATVPTSGGGTDTGTDTGDTGADTGDTGTETGDTGDTGETGSDTAETGDTGETGETAETGETGGSTEVVCAEESADGMYMPDQTICGPDGASATVKSEYAVYDSVEDLTIMSAADAWLDFQGEFDIDSTGYNGWTLYPDESAEGSYDLAVTDFAPPPSTQQYSTLRLTHGGLMAMDSEGNETHYQVLEDGTLQVTDSSGHVTNNEGNSVQLAGEPVEEDTGNLDTGDTGDTGGVDTNDTAVDTNDSADKETADTAGWGQNPDTGNGSGGCNCATAVDTSSSGLKAWVLSGIAALSLLARRRK